MLDATPLLRLYGRRRRATLARQDPATVQTRQLLDLVAWARDTRFGRDHDFAGITDVAGFQERVPLRRFEDFWTDYWRDPFPVIENATWPGRIPFFAVTSGTTTGVTKHIPVSREMVTSNVRAGVDMLCFHVANRPDSRVMGGRSFMLGGSADLEALAPGVQRGDLSGIAQANTPWWARGRVFPPPGLAAIREWERRIDQVAEAMPGANLRLLGGVPSWLLILLDRMRKRHGRDVADLLAGLDVLVHGGVPFGPYRGRFERLLPPGCETREVYPASEGFIASADRGPDQGLRMNLDIGLFYEFVPMSELDSDRPTRHWIANAETGVDYALVLSNCAGAWGYILGDTVRLVDRDPPRLLVTGRTSFQLSAFGEHLIMAEIDQAVTEGARAIGAEVTDYAAGAVFPEAEGDLGGHVFVVEFASPPDADAVARFARVLDESLAETNEDYREHRAGGFGLKAPEVRAVPAGTFAEWMRRRGRLGGQNKVPRVINDDALFADLRAFAEGHD